MNSTTKTNHLTALLQRVQTASGVSGIALAVAQGQEPPMTYVAGEDTRGYPLAEDSLFPVPKITKMGTSPAI
jgi:hypothetical protein